MSTTHGHSLTTHVTTTRVYSYSIPCSHSSVCFELCKPLQEKMLERGEGEKTGKNNHGHHGAVLNACFCLNVTGLIFVLPCSLRHTAELHLCFKCLRTGSCPLAELFCKEIHPNHHIEHATAHILLLFSLRLKLCGQRSLFFRSLYSLFI